MKQCKRCKKWKNISYFYRDKRTEDKHRGVCKTCVLISTKKYHKTNKGKKTLTKSSLKQHHNMTLEQFDRMFEAQNGVCAICDGINKDGRRLAVDHNHKTGKVRGLLCVNCNRNLAALETWEFTQQAKQYLCIK